MHAVTLLHSALASELTISAPDGKQPQDGNERLGSSISHPRPVLTHLLSRPVPQNTDLPANRSISGEAGLRPLCLSCNQVVQDQRGTRLPTHRYGRSFLAKSCIDVFGEVEWRLLSLLCSFLCYTNNVGASDGLAH
jgi:hypothetical protein